MSDVAHSHLVLIGGQRCGTTWLGRLLGAQRAVRTTRVLRPEPKFFLDDDDHARYDRLFAADGGGWWLDKSTTYLERADAATRARRCVPDALILVVLRDPVERVHSNWRFSVVNDIEHLSFEDSLTATAQQRSLAGLSTSPYDSLRRGRYAELLGPWLDAFGDRVVALQYERMVSETGPAYVGARLATAGLELTDSSAIGPVNEAVVDAPMSESARSWLTEYYRLPNLELARTVDGIDLGLWQH